jgi:hypothetical protein
MLPELKVRHYIARIKGIFRRRKGQGICLRKEVQDIGFDGKHAVRHCTL